jgi:CHASE2 domain-containing sensor protein
MIAVHLPACLKTACAATQASGAVAASAPGFLAGLWHGFIFPLAFLVSLFASNIAIYAEPNNGGWYDFGFFLGIVVFGVGARRTMVRGRR